MSQAPRVRGESWSPARGALPLQWVGRRPPGKDLARYINVEARFGFVDRSTIFYNTFNEVTGSRTTFITLSCVPNSRLNLWNLDKKIESVEIETT